MRIIAGRFRRRLIQAPPGNNTRPTTDRAREAMFNMVSAQLDLTEARVLDLFSGSGALGLEAMSRGATHLDFVEQDRIALSFARDNAKSLDADLAVNFHQTDVFTWIKSQPVAQYQLILADPPYELTEIEELLNQVLPLLAPEGLFVLEHARQSKVEDLAGFITTRFYGKSAVSLFLRPIQD